MRSRPADGGGDLATSRAALLDCLQAALRAVDARRRVAAHLRAETPAGRWRIVAVGKAAGAMTAGAIDVLDDRVGRALVVTKPGHAPTELEQDARVSLIESSHPVPDARSLEAGEAIAGFIAGLEPDARLLWLVSGGASSLAELPVPGVSLEDLQRVYRWLLSSGLDIAAANAVRRRLSRLKGGGLAALAGRRTGLALFVSDVPADDPAIIGSGLLHATETPSAEPESVPDDVRALLARCPARASPRLPPVAYRVVASISDACAAARRCGRDRGYTVRSGRGRFAGDAARLGHRYARRVAAAASGTLWVWGGESTVRLPASPGRGGRNQHLALAAAIAFADVPGVALLAAGTDGVDGVTVDAGGIVDGTTMARGAALGFDARDHLRRADAGSFLAQCGDLLHTGITMTNVGDLVLGLAGPRAL